MTGRLLLITSLLLLLAGCGQKGPLYQPSGDDAAPTAVGSDTTADESVQEQQKDTD